MQFNGKTVSGGIAAGRVKYYRKEDAGVPRTQIDDAEAEIARFEKAKESVKRQISGIYEKARKEMGEAGAAIFEVHQMLLDDLNFVESVTELIEKEKVSAEYAVQATCDRFSAMFETMDNAYMQARSADVRDIGSQVIADLRGIESHACDGEEPVILLADDLSPSEAVRLDRARILALVTKHGSANSHTAILVRTMGIPALTNVELDGALELDGHMAIVDGSAGLLLIDPDEETLEKYRTKQKEETERTRLRSKLRGSETVTKGGRRICLCANIGGMDDTEAALRDGVDGIGLFRSEFLYLRADDFPGEEEQFEAYRAVAERMAGKRVVIRTLDIGADKRADYFRLPKEANPALGLRGIRVSLERPDILKTQLRAILRASCYGNVSVMYPMIISVEEVRRARRLAEEAKTELIARNIPYGEVEQGIMIETPAAVWLSEELAKEADFFSIGTNDLTQYMLAADRQDPALDAYYDPHHPAVLGAVRAVVENGHKKGIRVGICGELAADTALTEEFLRMGIDELSVSPAHILPVRAAVRESMIS